MTDKATLEQVETLAAQLPPQEQLKLVEHVQEWLLASDRSPVAEEIDEERVRQVRLENARALIAALDAIALSIGDRGPLDSAQDIREIREERARVALVLR